MYMCLKFSLRDLNSGPFSPHPTSTYICRVTIASKLYSNFCLSFDQGALSHQMSLHYTISHMIPKLIGYQIRLYKCLVHGRLLGLTLKV